MKKDKSDRIIGISDTGKKILEDVIKEHELDIVNTKDVRKINPFDKEPKIWHLNWVNDLNLDTYFKDDKKGYYKGNISRKCKNKVSKVRKKNKMAKKSRRKNRK